VPINETFCSSFPLFLCPCFFRNSSLFLLAYGAVDKTTLSAGISRDDVSREIVDFIISFDVLYVSVPLLRINKDFYKM